MCVNTLHPCNNKHSKHKPRSRPIGNGGAVVIKTIEHRDMTGRRMSYELGPLIRRFRWLVTFL